MSATPKTINWMTKRSAGGFTTIQLVITLAVVTVVSAFAIMGIKTARASVRLNGATRQMAGYLEKARGDAIRRHGSSNVTIASTTSYTVNMDSNLDGIADAQTITLPSGVALAGIPVNTVISFNWRGQANNEASITLSHAGLTSTTINISGAGDITLNGEILTDTDIARVTVANVDPTVAAGSPSGGGSSSPTPTPTPTSTPTPTPTPT
ncbi:MAG: GspH/FimT family protein, partial [Acidobacteriota bacterium]|nr:GspH/FimT family protein [Acidobacteriota bacterium]